VTKPSLARRATAEALGTAFLLATVVGSGIMGEKLSGGNVAIALLANTMATGAGLVALILTFGPISGAHMNPAVSRSHGGVPMAGSDRLPRDRDGDPVKAVLFACVHNAGRSQMAAAWFNCLADSSKARAISAGTQPGTEVHPVVLGSMAEVGIDLSGVSPRLLTDDLAAGATILVTMGCGEACPVVPGLRREDWPLEDPKGKTLERVREIRDDVRQRVVGLIDREGWG